MLSGVKSRHLMCPFEIVDANMGHWRKRCSCQHLKCVAAGVPLKRSVAGVAMGLILEPDGRFVVLTDILGSEDALGDMDFKVAGDADGVTAFQMDIKVCSSAVLGLGL